jgi:hypothetical protein
MIRCLIPYGCPIREDWMAKLCWESKEMGWKYMANTKYRNWSLRSGIVWSLQRPSPKFKGRRSILVYSLPEIALPIQRPRSCQILFFSMKKDRHPLDHSLGFRSCSTRISFKSVRAALVKKYCHVDVLKSNNLWTLASSVKGWEAEVLVSCDLIDGNRWPLNLRP